jgi:hypothetical protein
MIALGRTGHVAKAPENEAATPASIALAPLELDTVPFSAREEVYDDLIQVHRASRLESISEVRAVAQASLAIEPAPAASESIAPMPTADALGLGETILRRGSTWVFAREAITREELATIMATSRAPLKVDSAAGRELSDQQCRGRTAAGAYYYRRERNLRTAESRHFGRGGLPARTTARCHGVHCYMGNLERSKR